LPAKLRNSEVQKIKNTINVENIYLNHEKAKFKQLAC